MPVLVDDVGELLDVRRDLRLQRRRQHLPGPITDQLIQQRPRRLGRRLLRSFLSNYLQHGRTFPTGVGSPALLEEPDGTSGRYALRAPQPEISDPQVSSIPLAHRIDQAELDFQRGFIANGVPDASRDKVTGKTAAAQSTQIPGVWFVAVEFANTNHPDDVHVSVWAVSDPASTTAPILSVDHWAYGMGGPGTFKPAPKSYVADPAAFAAWRAVETDPNVYLS